MTKNNTKETTYAVYIIESLRLNDFKDGKNLHNILKVSGIKSVYRWANDKEDFQRIIKNFIKSKFRYLHLSFHSDQSGLEIKDEEISNSELQEYLREGLINKRVFMSSCKGANRDLSTKLIVGGGALSIIGTPIDLYFHKSALFWPPFYYLLNQMDSKIMTRSHLKTSIVKCVELFSIPINYYSKIENDSKYIRLLKVRAGQRLYNRKLLISRSKHTSLAEV